MTEPSAFSLAAGARLGRYEVLKPLARGGMGEVYLGRVRGESATRPVALKILRPELRHDAEVRSMFADEAAMLLRLDHTSIVRAVEIVQDDDRVVLVMEYVRGRSGSALLRAWKERPPASAAVAVEIGIRVARAVHHVHEARGDDGVRLGLVHRDLSPDNVMLRPDGGVKLIDFGIARATAQTSVTSVGVLKGKVSYMSPEQLRQDPLDRRSDVFQLGTLLFELVTRRHPFSGNNFAATVNAILSGDAPDPREHEPRLDDALAEAILRALEFEPEDRFESAAEFASALEDALRNSANDSRGDLEAEFQRTFGEPNADEPTIVVGPSAAPPRPRRRVVAGALACAALAVAAASVAALAWQDVADVATESAAMEAFDRSRTWGGVASVFALAGLGLGWVARRRRAATVVLGAALTGCVAPERPCSEATPCDLHEHGYCDADSMRCVYGDASCPGGGRWGPFAGASARACVPPPVRDDVATARPLSATPVLDGDPHELMLGAPVQVSSPFGVSGDLWFRTTDAGLYVGAVITDPLLEASRPSYQPLWEEDGLELLFDTAWDRGAGQMPGTDDFKFVVTAVNATSVSWAGVSPRTAWSLPIESAVRTQGTLNQPSDADGGYTIELLIPWGGGFERPADGAAWGLNFKINDRHGNSARSVQWREGTPLNHPSGAGVLVFGTTEVPPEEPRPSTPQGSPYEPVALADTVVSVSEDLREDQAIGRAFDGCLASRDPCAVATGQAASVSIVFDLGRSYALGGARLFGNTRHDWISRTWSLRIRDGEDSPWTSVVDREDAFVEGWVFAPLQGTHARFLELTVTGDEGHGVEFNEFELLARPLAP